MANKRASHVTGERPVRLNEAKPPTAGLDKRRKKKEGESRPATSVRYCQHPAGCHKLATKGWYCDEHQRSKAQKRAANPEKGESF